MNELNNIAIACQGGGSHTAFTAGVLEHLFQNWNQSDQLVGISGTSGGAFNALGAWYGLVTGDCDKAGEIVIDLWEDLAADDYTDRMTNEWLKMMKRLDSSGLPMPRFSPYQIPGPEPGKVRIREILETHIDFDSITDHCKQSNPDLVVGTVNVNAGEFETFTNEDVTVEAFLASAADPHLFEAVEINGHMHWDGLFSQNPPINDLMKQPPERKPNELWVIQINQQETTENPKSPGEIADRRNELSGNLSLNQELKFIEEVNEWVESGKLPDDEFTYTDIQRIELPEQFHCSTKLDRDPDFIKQLINLGRDSAESFLERRGNSTP